MNLRNVHVWTGWTGWIFTAGFLLACCPLLAWTIPPRLGPMATPLEVQAFYVENLVQIRAGAWIGMVASAFYYPWGAAIAAMTRRIENGRPPILTYTQLGAVGVAVFNSVLYFFWMAFCAFRADTMDPELLRTLNDFQFILLEFEVFPLSLWAVAIGLAILLDDSQRPVFPRYAAWVNFWFAGLVMTGQFMIFFKTGPLAWNGLLALYWPAAVFFIWICIMSALVIQGVKRGDGVVEGASQDRYPSAPIEPMLVRVAAHNGSGQAGT
ncbi:MAG: hypothetical protein KA760_10210 [Steroidobacteraceae bacterium]|nr:hypothetical protein [Steroidobacteraceae bacterium]